MPAKHQRTSSPAHHAEMICSLLHAVPWARACFLERTRTESTKLHTALINSPEVDRWHSLRNFKCIGVYQTGATKEQVLEDVRETMGKM